MGFFSHRKVKNYSFLKGYDLWALRNKIAT